MTTIGCTIALLRESWGVSRPAMHRGKLCPFPLACDFSTRPAEELTAFPLHIPPDLKEFWQVAESATLFKDQRYGQWGIELLTPQDALRETAEQAAARPQEFRHADLVVGRFLGDSDLLLISCDPEQANFGSVTVASPLDGRKDWPEVAQSLGILLSRLLDTHGDKYWEQGGC